MSDTMIDLWLERYRRGLVGTIMDYAPNEKAPAQILRGAFMDYLRLTLAEKAGFEPAEGITPRTLSRRVT